jgi:tRNA (mo5U34)-methyltransferase
MWTEDRIRARIAEFEQSSGWYHDIDLGRGIHTKTRSYYGEDADHPRRRFAAIAPAVPADMTGMSVLDVGCNAGYFAFEAKRRGAATVCGIDQKPGYIDEARFCADVLGLEVDFRVLSVYELERLGRQFDFVFFVGLLYHCEHLIQAVRQVAAVAGRRVVIETECYPKGRREPLVRFGTLHPRSGYWHPNVAAVAAMFESEGFPRHEVVFKWRHRCGMWVER